MTPVLAVLTVLGAGTFALGVGGADAPRVWSIYLVNVVFWSALAATGPAIAGMMQLTEARWSPSVRRIALTTAGFLPVSVLLLAVLAFGRKALYSWETHPIAVKAAWLNGPFFWSRTLILAALLTLVTFAFIASQLRDPAPSEAERERGRRNRLAVILLVLWMITLSLWGYDLIMSLDPRWVSGLFGGYFVVSALYTTFALLSILTIRANARGLAAVPPGAVQDVAKLQFGMCVMWMYFFWSQYLVIWYGNVPAETRYVAQRFFIAPWKTLAWVVFVVGWLIPFAYLLKRLTGRPPARHAPLFVVAVLALVAIFLERVLTIFPSVSLEGGLPFSPRDVLITLGFWALFILARRWFMGHFRPVLDLPHSL
jgi:hypothetical protein